MTQGLSAALVAALDDDALEALARKLAPLLAGRLGQSNATKAWLNTQEAAEYLACSPGRLYDLVQLDKLQPRRDGRRLLFRKGDLDAYLEGI